MKVGRLPVCATPLRRERLRRDSCTALFGAHRPAGQPMAGHALASLVCCALLLLSGCRTPSPEIEPVEDVPPDIAVHIPVHRAVDRRPYEFIWTERRPEQDALLRFERLLGWRLAKGDGVTSASFTRNQERQLWGDYVGAFTYSADAGGGWALLEPPTPILVRDPVDTVTCWIHGDPRFSGAESAPTVNLIFETARGTEHSVPIALIDWNGWWKVHRRLASVGLDSTDYPLALTGIRFHDLPDVDEAVVYMDSLSLYSEPLSSLRYPNRARRPLPLRAGQRLGVNTGEGVLPFPTNEWTVIPWPDPEDSERSIESVTEDTFALSASFDDHDITYLVEATNGLRIAHVLVDGEKTGITFPPVYLEGEDSPVPAPAVVRAEADHLYVEYGRGDVYRISMRGRSLIIDVSYRGGDGTGVFWSGPAQTDHGAELYVPYLHEPGFAVPPVTIWTGYTEPLFMHVRIDPYRSNASGLVWDKSADEDPWAWRLGARYDPAADGRRNDVHERFVVTVAPRMEQVLPVVPHSPASQATQLVSRLAFHAPAESGSYRQERRRADRLMRWGMRNVAYGLSPAIWREQAESYSFRLRANPHRGGDTALRTFIDGIQDQGWLALLYANYRDISPLNAFWSSDKVLRSPSGDWVAAEEPAYRVKLLYALSWVEEHAAQRKETFGAEGVYLDGHTAQPPWTFTDFDHRMPGAATFSQVFFADGELMLEKRRQGNGPVVAQAQGAALYAGLVDGMFVERTASWRPYLPSFKLKRLQRLGVMFGAGDPADIRTSEDLDRYLADTIAYGNAGRVVYVPEKAEHTVRSYYALQALQQRYQLQTPKRVMYWTGEEYASVDEALTSDTWKRSQLYVEYPGDFELWVNGSETNRWDVRVGAERYALPPSGWVAVAPEFLAFSGLFEDRRIDYVVSEDYIYLDPRGYATAYGKLKGAGPLVLRVEGESEYELLDIAQTGEVAVHERSPVSWEDVRIACYDDAGDALGPGSVTQDGAWHLLSGPEGTVIYRLYP